MTYMKETLAAYKEEHPELSHKESFAAVRVFLGHWCCIFWESVAFTLFVIASMPAYLFSLLCVCGGMTDKCGL
jgi:hypothetical protein